jgi:FkbM family methyltransferase
MKKSLLDEQSSNTNEWTPEPFYHDLYNDLFYKDVIFPGKKDGYFVEVGALDGMIMSQSYLFEKVLNWKGIVVEPNPVWKDALFLHRECNISTEAISDKQDVATFECREIPAFSGLKSSVNDARMSDIINEFDVKTITLCDLFDKFNAPEEIDWVSIDTEGAELVILEKFFSENTKYKINLLSFESHQLYLAEKILDSQPYFKIKNPYLDFMKISNQGLLKFNPFTGELFRSPIKELLFDGDWFSDNLQDVNFEHYYIHADYLKNNPNLKKLLLSRNHLI